LPDPTGGAQEVDARHRLDGDRTHHRGDDLEQDNRGTAVEQRRDAEVDASLDQEGGGQSRQVLEHDGDHEEAEGPAVRPEQVGEQALLRAASLSPARSLNESRCSAATPRHSRSRAVSSLWSTGVSFGF